MKRYKLKINLTVEIDAFTAGDAEDVVIESVRDLDGLGITVLDATVDSVDVS